MVQCQGHSPGETAEMDQQWAAVNHRLDGLLYAYEGVRTEGPECDLGVRVGLADFISDVIPSDACAEILAAAVDRIRLLSKGNTA